MMLSSIAASILILLSGASVGDTGQSAPVLAAQTGSPHTPARGSAERMAIMDAMRAHRRQFDSQAVIFVVSYLRVQNGWAWLTVAPQSPDGRQHYEEESALLRLRSGQWRVVEEMPAFGEREGTPDEEDCAWFAHLRRRFPGLPVAVLPPEGRHPCPAPPRRGR